MKVLGMHAQAEGTARLTAGLLSNKTLQHLSLAWNGLYDDGCYPLASVIAGNTSMKVTHSSFPSLPIQATFPPFSLTFTQATSYVQTDINTLPGEAPPRLDFKRSLLWSSESRAEQVDQHNPPHPPAARRTA